MKKAIVFLICILMINIVSATHDFEIANEIYQDPAGNEQNMWIDGSNGMIRESGGQTFIAPETGNITGFKIKVLFATGSNTMYVVMSTVDTNHYPNSSSYLGSRLTNSFVPGWNTWNFTSPYPVIQGKEYAIWWDGVYTYTGTHTVFAKMTNGSVYSGGGELIRDWIWGPSWSGGTPAGRDWIMNLTYAGDLPVPPVEEPIQESGDNIAGNSLYISQISNRLKQETVCDNLICKIHQFIMNLRKAIGLEG